MKKLKLILLGAFALVSFNSCDIERLPYGSVSSEQITNDPEGTISLTMIGTYHQLKNWSDPMHRCGEYAGDNMMIRGSSTDAFYEFITYSRTPDNFRLTNMWDYSYIAIAQASNIISTVEEGISDEVDQQIGEAYFIRGMVYFYLCRAFGRPYYDNPTVNLGVPIVNGTPEDVTNIELPDRSPVADVYEQVIADLEKGAELMNEDKGPAYGSKYAAYALLSRVYLYMSGSWASPNTEYAAKCIEYSNKVINDGPYTLLDRAAFMTYNTLAPESNSESIFVVKRVASEYSGTDHYTGIGGMYSNIGGMGWGEMYASKKYLDLLDETGRNDWYNGTIVDARAAFIEPQYTKSKDGEYVQPVFRYVTKTYDASGNHTNFDYSQDDVLYDEESGLYTCTINAVYDEEYVLISYDKVYDLTVVDAAQGIYSIEHSVDGTVTGYIDEYITLNRAYPEFYIVKCSRETEDSQLHSPIITRLAEMYLNLAEAQAKSGDLGSACSTLNVIRERSLPGEGYSSLTADNYVELIEKERQLELAYQAERSYDVYRNGMSLTRQYPGPHDALEEIQPNDYRTIYFIPTDAINDYGSNTLTQNPTSN